MKGLVYAMILSTGLFATHQWHEQSNSPGGKSDTIPGKNVPGEKELMLILRESPWQVYPSLDSGIVEFNKSPRPDSDMLTFEKGGKVSVTCTKCDDVMGTYQLKKSVLSITLYYPKNLASLEYSYQVLSADKDRIIMKNMFSQTVK